MVTSSWLRKWFEVIGKLKLLKECCYIRRFVAEMPYEWKNLYICRKKEIDNRKKVMALNCWEQETVERVLLY